MAIDLKFKFILLYVVLIFGLLYTFNDHKVEHTKSLIDVEVVQTKTAFELLQNNFKEKAQIVFNYLMYDGDIIKIYKKLQTASNTQKDDLRKQLQNKINTDFAVIQNSYQIEKIHFHLKNSESFFRVYLPNKYADSLKGIRKTVEYANDNKTFVSGFEIGRAVDAYRFIFPIKDKEGNHLGTVDIPFTVKEFLKEYCTTFDKVSNFHFSEKLLDSKTWKQIKNIKYQQSILNGYYFQKSILKYVYSDISTDKLKKPDQKFLDILNNDIELNTNKQIVSLYNNELKELFIFIPILNPITDKLIGYFGTRVFSEAIHDEIVEVYISYLVISILLALLFYFVYRRMKSEEESKLELEENKRMLEKEFQAVFENTKEPIGILDFRANFLNVNDAYTELLGFSKYELLGKNCIDLAIPEDIQRSKDALKEVLHNGFIKDFEKSCFTKDGTIVTVSLSMAKMPDDKRIIINAKDITKERILSNELQQLNQSLEDRVKQEVEKNMQKDQMLLQNSKLAIMGEMIAMIAHQWKQPLAGQRAILGTIELKRRLNNLTDDYLVTNLKDLDNICEHLANTIDDFANFFKPDKSKHIVEIKTLIDESISLISATFKNNGINLNIDCTQNIELNIFDREFKQVVINILNNAIDALLASNNKSKEINIDVSKVDEFVEIIISDNAGGIPDDVLLYIFDPYFSTKSKNGTGLGLYMSKIIVENHLNGKLSAYNENNKAVFKIELPIFNVKDN
jgi:PAS domain S-box-containing protein